MRTQHPSPLAGFAHVRRRHGRDGHLIVRDRSASLRAYSSSSASGSASQSRQSSSGSSASTPNWTSRARSSSQLRRASSRSIVSDRRSTAFSSFLQVLAIGRTARIRGHYTLDEFRRVCRWKTPRSAPLVALNSAGSVTVIHESLHGYGLTNEAQVNCYAVQLVPAVARNLGLAVSARPGRRSSRRARSRRRRELVTYRSCASCRRSVERVASGRAGAASTSSTTRSARRARPAAGTRRSTRRARVASPSR